MQNLSQLLDKQLENPSPESLLAACRAEGIHDNDLSELLDRYLSKIQSEKRTAAYWEEVRRKSEQSMELLNANQMGSKFMKTYHEKFGRDFVIDEWSTPIIRLLCQYFTNDPKFEESGYSLKKGILLHGGVGSGKTSILSCFTSNQRQSFRMMDCISVSQGFAKTGYDSLNDLVEGEVNRWPRESWGQKIFTYCFDDLGVETEKKHFGNETNVMSELIQMIYERKTMLPNVHFTTNLNAEQIKEIYGTRVASRLREMVNIILMPEGSPDRRS